MQRYAVPRGLLVGARRLLARRQSRRRTSGIRTNEGVGGSRAGGTGSHHGQPSAVAARTLHAGGCRPGSVGGAPYRRAGSTTRSRFQGTKRNLGYRARRASAVCAVARKVRALGVALETQGLWARLVCHVQWTRASRHQSCPKRAFRRDQVQSEMAPAWRIQVFVSGNLCRQCQTHPGGAKCFGEGGCRAPRRH